MILFHCDVCKKQVDIYQVITISSAQVVAKRGAELKQACEYSIDICSRKCALVAFDKLIKQILKEGFLP